MEFHAIKITGLMGKIRLVAEHSKNLYSLVSNTLKTIINPIKMLPQF
jgi:hypothetical protein